MPACVWLSGNWTMATSYPVLFVAVCSLIIDFPATSRSQNPVFSFPFQQSAVERGQLSCSSRNGDVFVGAGGTLYRLSSELQQLQNVSVPGSVLGLTITADGNYLVACFTNRICAVYNTTTLSNDVAPSFEDSASGSGNENTLSASSTFENVILLTTSTNTSVTLFIAPLLDGELTVFIGFLVGSRIHLLQRGFAGSSVLRNYTQIIPLSLVAGGGFVYFTDAQFILVATSSRSVSGLISYEVPVDGIGDRTTRVYFSCGGSIIEKTSVLTGVSEVDGTMVVSVEDGRVCTYDLTKSSLTPSPLLINGGVTISLAISVQNNSFLFVATTANRVEKHLFTAGSSGTTLLYSLPVSSSPVTALSWSADYVYATVGNQVVRFPLETCSSSTNCSSCVTNSDPLCGWCSVESKCSRKSQCQNNNETRRYIAQGDQSSCTYTIVFDPPQLVSGLESQINITVILGSLPLVLPGEMFLCVFSNEERGITFSTTLSQTMSCDLTSFLPPLTDIKLVTRFSLYSKLTETSPYSVENGYTFYNCSHGNSCHDCVETCGNCGWCLYDFSCTGQSQDCSIADSFVALNSSSQSYTDVCPVLSPPASSDSGGYVQPVNVDSPLTVSGSHFPPAIGSVQYMCRFGSRETTAQRLNSSAVRCTEQVLLSAGVSGRENRTFQLMLTNGSNVYTLDTSTEGSVFAVLYQCSDLAMGCSSCLGQRIGTDFQCGWCGNTCVDVSTSCSNFINVSGGCPAPMISAISPDSGPTDGGTTVTITGTNLGTAFSDIVSITVGSLNCIPIEDSYRIERRIACDIDSGNQTQGRVSVVVTIYRMGGADQNATFQFLFGQPRVYSVSPSYGPSAGGTMVRVRGEDLNIGNTERTTVSLVTTGSGRRQTTGTASCVITSISAKEISCSWSNFTADMTGVVLVTVDNAMVQNNTVTYQYLNNPVYTGLSPQQTIRAGGIKLTFTGQYLNASQQPILQFNNGQTNVTCPQSSSAGTTLVCIAPPLSALNSYSVVMDAAPGPDPSGNLVLVDNPIATQLREDSRTMSLGVNGSFINIDGQRITNVVKEEITVMVGRDQCVLQTAGDTVITCIAPQRDEPVVESVTVKFGQNINNSVGQLEYLAEPALDIVAIAGGASGGVVLLIFILLLLIFSPFCCYLSSISKYKQKLERAQQPVYVFVPPGHNQLQDAAIVMNDNMLYQDLVGVREDEHTYEQLPFDESIAAGQGRTHNYEYVIDHLDVGPEERARIEETKSDNYYVNDDLFPEEYKTAGRTEQGSTRS